MSIQVVNTTYGLVHFARPVDRMVFKTLGRDNVLDGYGDEYIFLEGDNRSPDGVNIIEHKSRAGKFVTLGALTRANFGQLVIESTNVDTAIGTSSAMSSVGYDSFTQRGINSFRAVGQAAAYSYVYQALASQVVPSSKVTVFYRTDPDSTGAAIRVSLFRSGTGIVSATQNLVKNGLINSVVLTNTHATLNATAIAFDSNGVADYGVRFAVFKGDLSATNPTTAALLNTLMSMMEVNAVPHQDTALRGIGLINSVPAISAGFDSTTVNALTDISLVNSSGFRYFNYALDSSISTSSKVTLIYTATGTGDSGATQVWLYQANGQPASTGQVITKDGTTRIITITATATAIRLFLTQNGAGTANIKFAVLKGDYTAALAVDSALQQALMSLIGIIINDIAARQKIDNWVDAEKQILLPTPLAFVTNRNVVWYGRNITYRRSRSNTVDVSLCAQPTETGATSGFIRNMLPDVEFNPSRLEGSNYIQVFDANYQDTVYQKSFTARLANASQTGTILFCMLGDSTAALALKSLKGRVNGTGATFSGVGTRDDGNGNNYEGRAGWSVSDYIGRKRPVNYANPFLRTADNTDKTNNPTLCFADDVSYGTGVRPSYAEDNTKASYSIFDFNYWRQNVAVNLNASDKLRLCVQLGRNDPSDLTTWELGITYIVENFRAVFVNGTIFVASETLAAATGNLYNGVTNYAANTAARIARTIKLFSNREADRVWCIPSWLYQTAYAGFQTTLTSTDTETGTQKRTVSDPIHYGGQLSIQWAESILGALLYVHQTT